MEVGDDRVVFVVGQYALGSGSQLISGGFHVKYRPNIRDVAVYGVLGAFPVAAKILLQAVTPTMVADNHQAQLCCCRLLYFSVFVASAHQVFSFFCK